MKTKVLFTTLLLAVMSLGLYAGAGTKSVVDTESSSVAWFAKKVGGAHDGHVAITEGYLVFDDGALSGGYFVIDMTSITCADISNENMNAKLVNHLKSDDFFGTADHPTATLKIIGAEMTEENTYSVGGEITIKGITKPVKFMATIDDNGDKITAYSAIELDRTDFDVRYGSKKFFDNLGDKFIFDNFKLEIELVATK